HELVREAVMTRLARETRRRTWVLEERALPPSPALPRSRRGEIYEFDDGSRVMCGDAEDPRDVALLLRGETPVLTLADAPYGIGLDQSWRDGVTQPPGAGRSDLIAN